MPVTDRQTDEHRGNSATTRSNERFTRAPQSRGVQTNSCLNSLISYSQVVRSLL